MQRLKFAVGLMSLTMVTALAGLVLAATAVPLVMGWDRVVLTSGSMMPLIEPGDIVIVSEAEHPIQPGTVITFTNPNKPGGLITHRILEVRPDGSYRTKGDANPQPDVSPVPRDTVIGKGTLLVPSIGLPTIWMQKGHTILAAAAAATVLLIAILSRYGLLRKHDPWLAPHEHKPTRETRQRRRPKWAMPAGALLTVALAAGGSVLAPKPTQGAFSASSSSTKNLLSTATAAPATTLYLKTNGTSDSLQPPAVLGLTSTTPTLTTLYNYDTLRDTAPGLLIAKGTGLLDDLLPTTIQKWMMPTRPATVLSGNAKVRLWTAMKGFSPTNTGSLTAGLYSCNPGTQQCSPLSAAATVTSQGSWSGGSSTWVPTVIDFGPVTLPANRVLQLRVAVGTQSSDAIMLAYDTTAYPARLTIG